MGYFFYQENKSLFIFSGEYLQKFLIKPGGFLEYAGNFLTQGYYNSAYGSLIISSLPVLFCFVFIKINRQLSADRSFSLLLILLPSCLLLLLQTRYDHLMHYNLGYLLVALWFFISIVIKGKMATLFFLSFIPGIFLCDRILCFDLYRIVYNVLPDL